MKDFFNELIRKILFWRRIIPAMFRCETGHFFSFRDTPTWVLEELEEIDKVRRNPDLDEMENFYSQARDELSLRNRNT